MSHANPFGWADDSTGPIDTTPAGFPAPPDSLIEAAARAVPPLLANVTPGHLGEIGTVAATLTAALVKQGHTKQAACWAIHRLVCEGRLNAKPAYDALPIIVTETGSRGLPGLKADTRQTTAVGGGYSVRPIPKGTPAPFASFRVVATDSLWTWWREIDAEKKRPPAGAPGTIGELIERLLAGPDDAELTPRELALLDAHLRNNRPELSWWQRQNRGENCPELARYLKLKTILDFNRNLQAALAPPAPPVLNQATGNAGSTPPAAKPDEGEAQARAGTPPSQPSVAPSHFREALLERMEPADLKAYFSYAYAESNLGTTTDRQAYQWLSDNGLPDERDSPELAKALAGYRLPSFATWSKQLRNARKQLGEQKHTRRAGRAQGRGSVVRASDLDSNEDDG